MCANKTSKASNKGVLVLFENSLCKTKKTVSFIIRSFLLSLENFQTGTIALHLECSYLKSVDNFKKSSGLVMNSLRAHFSIQNRNKFQSIKVFVVNYVIKCHATLEQTQK